MTMTSMLDALTSAFENSANPENALHMQKYLRDQFTYYGIKTQERRKITKAILKEWGLPDKKDYPGIVKTLWQREEREYIYFAMELAEKYVRQSDWKDLVLYEYMIRKKSWWDTVDFIATKLVGELFKKYPQQRKIKTGQWLESGNLWLQRTAILFQLKYKKETDTKLLFNILNKTKDIHTFFIEKAIGWALREYSKTDAKAVVEFVENNTLAPLSHREALKWLERNKKRRNPNHR